jgi:hypothetical protein
MEILRNSLIVLHLIGFASVLGPFLSQMKAMGQGTAKIMTGMVHGGWLLLITGLGLTGVAEWRAAEGIIESVNHAKIGVKLTLLVILLVLILVNRKKDSVKPIVIGLIGLLTITNVVLAVFW